MNTDQMIARALEPDEFGIAEAARLIVAGSLVAFPTETVYGLGADATNPSAIAALYAAKGRPHFNPLIAHVASTPAALALGLFDDVARQMAEAFWPGPLTLVVPAADDCPVCDLARAGLASLAIRVPADPVARAMLDAVGRPVAAPSANRSGHVSPSIAAHVRDDLSDRIAAILDGGPVTIGVESTIIGCLGETAFLLRPGGLARERIEALLGRPLLMPEASSDAMPLAPGRLASHYAPRARLRLNAADILPGEACLAFGKPPASADPALTLNLSTFRDLTEAAANLYAYLRALDDLGATMIAAMPVPQSGLGLAINDRLARAAMPRNPGS